MEIKIGQTTKWGILWFLWLLIGSIFYGYHPDSFTTPDGEEPNELGFLKGFYMAVNIGYSIGWGDFVETTTGARVFSTIYVIIGASFVAVALGFFADKVTVDNDNWFENVKQLQEYEANTASHNPPLTRISAFYVYHKEKFHSLAYWLFWIAIMIFYSMIEEDWKFNEALYFAVSSCSTGGHWSLPSTSEWMYGVTGFFAAIGVPLMGVAMASLADLFTTSESKSLERTAKTIAQPITIEEIKMMNEFDLDNGDEQLDRTEFIILSMVRMGTDPRLIKYISNRFKELDTDNSGSLSYSEAFAITSDSNSSIKEFFHHQHSLEMSNGKEGESDNKVKVTINKVEVPGGGDVEIGNATPVTQK